MEVSPDMANEPVSNTPKQSMPHLVTALSASLKAIDEDYKEEMRELRELLEEARKEAEKDEPSSQKLKALLADIGKMVRTFAALDPVWQGVQRIARMVGID
jgi:signal transduction histidine kinase